MGRARSLSGKLSIFAPTPNENTKDEADAAILAYNFIINSFEQSIARAKTDAEKLALATQNISADGIKKLASGEITLDQAINHPLKYASDVMNVFSLAIFLARVDSVERMLTLFDKVSINNPSYFAQGWRQFYSSLHFAAHSTAHREDIIYLGDTFPNTEEHIKARITIIRLLAARGANPNLVLDPGNGDYTNPPLVAGIPHAQPSTKTHRLRAALLLVGADPTQTGSSFTLSDKDRDSAIKEAAQQYLAMSQTDRRQTLAVIRKVPEIAFAILEAIPVANPEPDQTEQPAFASKGPGRS